MMKNRVAFILIIVAAFLLAGCYSAPRQTIELAEITDQQIAELHRSHLQFVHLYFDKLRADINEFMDNEWTPTFLAKAVQNPQFREKLDEAYRANNQDALGSVMLGFSEAALREINQRRNDLLDPIDEQERLITEEINAAYADLQRSQTAIKSYLASVVNLQEQQDMALKKMGVLEKSRQITRGALEKSDQLSRILRSGEEAEKILQRVKEMLNKGIE